MRRPTRSAGKTAKKPRPKSAAASRSTRIKSAISRDLQARVDALERELTEAREQQTATSEVLKIISSSPGELQPVFDKLLDNAIRICGARFGNLFLYGDGAFTAVMMRNAPAEFVRARTERPSHPGPDTALGRVERTKQTVQIADLRTERQYKSGDPFAVSGVELGGIRSLVSVPMLKDGELIGAINIYRQEVRPFTDKQVALLQTFAAQAVIAIENARLLNELRQRTDDLTESLEQQTATSEVLKVISGSPGTLDPVFDSILENATRICEAKFANLWLRDGAEFRAAAIYGAPE
jgi:GAF domain-containing protein